jgi:F-type H+-transporting ATPase subunit epsilon
MAKTVRLDIVTPEKLVLSEDVTMVIARATDGDIGILPGHAPLIAGLDVWPVRIQREEGEIQVSVCGGFIEVLPEKITILAGCAELPQDIDVQRAQAAKERAEERMRTKAADIDIARAEFALRRALMRLRVADYKQKL